MHETLGIDVGGTFVKAGLVDDAGRILQRGMVPTDVDGGCSSIEARIAEAADLLGGGHPDLPLGVGLPGIVNPTTGVVAISPNFPCWKDYPAASRLGSILGRTVRVDNDANCAAVAEHWIGAGRGLSSFLMLTLGTGIGGGVIIDGRVWRGESGRGGEIGHVVVDPGGYPCGCGGNGCVETVASAAGIARMAGEAGLAGSIEDLAARARNGGPRELAIFERAGRALGIAVADCLNILDLHTVVVGGGMSAALDLLSGWIAAEVGRRAYALPPGALRIVPALLGNEAGVVGAARMASAG